MKTFHQLMETFRRLPETFRRHPPLAGTFRCLHYFSSTCAMTSSFCGLRVSIVNFIVMNGVNTGLTAEDVDAKAAAIDTEVLTIANNFWTRSGHFPLWE